MEKLKKLKANHASLFAAFVFEGLAHAVGESHVDWVCEELAAKGGLDKDQTETDAQAEEKVVEEADEEATIIVQGAPTQGETQASQAQTPIPMPATTPGSTATTSTAVGQEEQEEASQSHKTSRKRKTMSTPQARLARELGPSSQGSVAFGSDLPRRRSQRKNEKCVTRMLRPTRQNSLRQHSRCCVWSWNG